MRRSGAFPATLRICKLSVARAAVILGRAEACLIRRNRSLIVQLLSLAFLFVQLGSVLHASTHLKSDKHANPAQLCGQCLSSAPLQNMVGGGGTVIAIVEVAHQRAADLRIVSAAPRRAFAGFRSRAPPALH